MSPPRRLGDARVAKIITPVDWLEGASENLGKRRGMCWGEGLGDPASSKLSP